MPGGLMPTATQEIEVSRGALWFGLLGGAIAWTLHLMLAYVVAEFGCVGRWGERSYQGITLVAWLEVALTVTTALAAGAATFVAYRIHRRLSSEAAAESATVAAERNIAWAGFLTSGLFTLVILFESIPILYYLQHC
jgi:hypothetical protein